MTAPTQTQTQSRDYWRDRARAIAAEVFGADSPVVPIFLRMINQESGFNPSAYNQKSGASGIAQFMPATAASLGVDPWNPEQALRGAAGYLKSLIGMFGGDVAKGVAAYNAGPGTVQQALRAGGANWTALLPDETKLYLRNTVGGAGADAGTGAPGAQDAQDAGPLGGFLSTINRLLAPARERDTAVINEAIRTTFQQLDDLDRQIADYQRRLQSASPNESLTISTTLNTLQQTRANLVRSLTALQNALRPAGGESPASLITALTGVGTLVTSMAHTAFADNLDAQRFIFEVLKHNDQLAQDRFLNLLATHKATTDDLQALVAARHLLQADQLAIAAATLARAGFIAQQRAWNAVHLYRSVTGTQPGFGLDEPAAKAMRALGFTPVSPQMTPVNPEDFDPIKILEQAQATITGTTAPIVSKVPTEEDYGIPQLQAQAAAAQGLAGAIPPGTPHQPPAVLPPNYADLLGQVFGSLGVDEGDGQGQGQGQGQEGQAIDWSAVPGPTPAMNPPSPADAGGARHIDWSTVPGPTPPMNTPSSAPPSVVGASTASTASTLGAVREDARRRFGRYRPVPDTANQPGGVELWP